MGTADMAVETTVVASDVIERELLIASYVFAYD